MKFLKHFHHAIIHMACSSELLTYFWYFHITISFLVLLLVIEFFILYILLFAEVCMGLFFISVNNHMYFSTCVSDREVRFQCKSSNRA
jgi:hypothetical protein